MAVAAFVIPAKHRERNYYNIVVCSAHAGERWYAGVQAEIPIRNGWTDRSQNNAGS